MAKLIPKLFFITFFINLTIPKAGIYLYKREYDFRIPVTLGYILFLFLLSLWLILNRKDLKDIFLGSFIKKMGMLYLIYAFLKYLSSIPDNYRYIGQIGLHFIIYGGYLLAFYFALDLAKYGKEIIPSLGKIIAVSMCMVTLYALMQVFFDSEKISLDGLTELYGALREPITSHTDGGYNVLEGSASMKSSIFSRGSFVGRKVFSTFLHGNVFAGHLVLFTPVVLSLLYTAVKRNQKTVYFCLAVIIVLSLLFTNSRGALLGFFISGLTMFLIIKEKKKAFLLLASIFLCGLMLFCLILGLAERYNFKITSADAKLYRTRAVQSRYGTIFEIPRLFGKKLASLRHPVDTEQNSIDAELDETTNFRYRDLERFSKGVMGKQNLIYLIFGRGYNGMYVYQNLYLNIIYNLGMVGFLIFLGIIIYILMAGIKCLAVLEPGHFPEAWALSAGGISGIAGFLTHNLFDNLFYFPPLGLNFWILSGLIVVAADYGEKP